MKESKLIEMSNKIDTIGAALNRLIQELNNLKDLSIGTMELMKCLPDYEKALKKLKKDLTTKKEEKSVKQNEQ
jgi:predicted ATP-grasp superfamily ATP-dependent carboligase|tara:strand:+ start:1014 stop:1232 length:219 start_codon:yes stop_codon:yes gene_type:complete